MERYAVVVMTDGSTNRLRLLIPYLNSAAVTSFTEEVAGRANRRDNTLDPQDCILHLGGVDGPILDPQDILVDLVRNEEVFAHFQSQGVGNTVSCIC